MKPKKITIRHFKMEQAKNHKFSFLVSFLTYFVVDAFRTIAARSFERSGADNFFILLIIMAAGYFYHDVQNRIKIKHIAGKALISFLIIEVIAIVAIWLLAVQ
jgi:hypothetical protein